MASYPGNRWDVRDMTSLFRVAPVRCSLKVCVYLLDDLPKRRCPLLYKPCDPDSLAYLDFSVSTTGMLAGVKVWLIIVTNIFMCGLWIIVLLLMITFLNYNWWLKNGKKKQSFLFSLFLWRCLTMQPVPCVALLNCSVSCIPLVRWPCVSTRTVALVSSCGVSAGTDHLRTHLRCTHRCKHKC